MRVLCATNVMTNTKPKPSKQFMEDFKLCMEYYEVEIEEAKYERDRVINNMCGAERCYSVIAAGIRGMNYEKSNKNS